MISSRNIWIRRGDPRFPALVQIPIAFAWAYGKYISHHYVYMQKVCCFGIVDIHSILDPFNVYVLPEKVTNILKNGQGKYSPSTAYGVVTWP